MTNILHNLAGMAGMTDQVIAADYLISIKSAIRNLSFAITETATPELRDAFREQLRSAVENHENITNYLIETGFYHPNDLSEQIRVDLDTADIALNLAD
ncbi:spore coat protein [Bacillus sp. ISL-35]|uniref:spore coat protein n=1 Tax=Bacillus sp. ISL-35 TaxID=2819122 RepID=UPI001BEB2722|nr:spore coat protein [Bacillus sp. ISL-35]MBT2679542.1 spore coat protein [Bacillus sp. ISL-35]MBT2703445.1 spore coat protein [Chryseobacterium sp. ISL-80]